MENTEYKTDQLPAIQDIDKSEKEFQESSTSNPVWSPEEKSIGDRGFTNGIFRLGDSREHFVQYIKYKNECERLSREILYYDKKLASIEYELKEGKNRRALLVEKIPAFESKISFSTKKKDLLENELYKQEQELESLTKKQHDLSPEYGWIASILFLLAGIVFILSDVAINYGVTAWGYNMIEEESIIFAIGLAFTAFLIKPFFDRMFEKEYQKNGRRMSSIMIGVYTLIMIIGLIMLIILGVFRSDAQDMQGQINSLNSQINNEQSLGNDATQLINQQGTLSKDINSNVWGKIGIVLSGIVFAIGGAISFSISLPNLSQLSSKYWFIPLIKKKIGIGLKQNREDYLNTIQELAEYDSMLKNTLQEISVIEDSKLLENENNLNSEARNLRIAYFEAKTLFESSYYIDGYSRGEKYEMEGIPKVYFGLDTVSTEEQTDSLSTSNIMRNKYRRRPFIKLRQIVYDNLDN